ncbi:MAG: hypothetical protein HYV60_07320 [Planctomycetia bacterium]|nr:hypothetical protein [Planctomycetia bacterium]
MASALRFDDRKLCPRIEEVQLAHASLRKVAVTKVAVTLRRDEPSGVELELLLDVGSGTMLGGIGSSRRSVMATLERVGSGSFFRQIPLAVSLPVEVATTCFAIV